MFYYQLDADKVKDILTIQDISIFSYLLEKYYNKPIQIEYITSEVYSENFSRSTMQTSILQARFLPKNYSYIEEIHFPNKEVLFE
jgi:hypothetical protein